MTGGTTLERFRLVIDGEMVDAARGATFPTVDPHTGQAYGEVAEAGEEDVARAVAAARRAFDEGPWPKMSTQERRRLLNRLADRVEAEFGRLAEAETRDMGKPITEARSRDIPRVVGNLRFFADFADLAPAETFPVRDLRTPFGGAKRSGIGREGGAHSREFFTEAKTVTVALR